MTSKVKDISLMIAAVIAGTTLYLGLNWIPVIGPVAVGLTAGYIAGGSVRRGFTAGILSGLGGFTLLLYILLKWGVFNSLFHGVRIETFVGLLLLWIILLWNIIGVALAGLGGVAGVLLSNAKNLFKNIERNVRIPSQQVVREEQMGPQRIQGRTYVICPNCGVGNPESNSSCISCGTQFKKNTL